MSLLSLPGLTRQSIFETSHGSMLSLPGLTRQSIFLEKRWTPGSSPGVTSPGFGARVAMNPRSWWQRLTGGLKATSTSLGSALSDLVTKRKLDAAMLEDIEEALIRA